MQQPKITLSVFLGHAGIVIFGDPLIVPSGDVKARLATGIAPAVSSEQLDRWRRVMVEVAQSAELGTFADYRAAHPRFFK